MEQEFIQCPNIPYLSYEARLMFSVKPNAITTTIINICKEQQFWSFDLATRLNLGIFNTYTFSSSLFLATVKFAKRYISMR